MAQWGNTDDAANSVLWAVSQLNKTANTDNQTNLFGNTTADAFVTGATVGQFGLDATEIAVTNASVVSYTLTFAGSGYSANATVTVGGNATANAQAGATGRISAVNVVLPGNSYTTSPSVTIAAPSLVIFNGNTNVSGATIAITSANSKFLVGDKIVFAGNTTSVPGGLVDNSTYYIAFSNTSVVTLSATPGGANIALTKASGDSTTAGGATLRGETATATAVISGVSHGAAHTGWVLRRVGSGGRAGRVQYETLVAMGGNLSTDAEDTILKDA